MIPLTSETLRELLDISVVGRTESGADKLLYGTDSVNKMGLLLETMAETIRQVSRSQVRTWERVPELVLEADGRKEFNSSSYTAFACRIWEIRAPEVCIDLTTGEIVYWETAMGRSISPDIVKPATSHDIIDAVVIHKLPIDALDIVTGLIHTIKRYESQPGAEVWRAQMRKQHQLPIARYH